MPFAVKAYLNTLAPALWVELFGLQTNHGGIDTKVVLVADIPVVAELRDQQDVESLYQSLKSREITLVADEIQRSDRLEFDLAVLGSIGLTQTQVREIHEFVARSAEDRITKSRRNVTQRGRHSQGNE